MQDLFLFEREGMDADGNVAGRFRATGIRPRCADRLQQYGIDLAGTLFSEIDPRLKSVRGGA
jgi:pilus assembly protein CpaF